MPARRYDSQAALQRFCVCPAGAAVPIISNDYNETTHDEKE
jgi:hypothetical protein